MRACSVPKVGDVEEGRMKSGGRWKLSRGLLLDHIRLSTFVGKDCLVPGYGASARTLRQLVGEQMW